jgi:hypothetical protein
MKPAASPCAPRLAGVEYGRIHELREGFELMLLTKVETRATRFAFHLIACFCLAQGAVAGQDSVRTSSSNSARILPTSSAADSVAKAGAWSGILVSSSCNADEAFAESPECTKEVPGAKLALYDDTNRVMYGLEPQEKVNAHLGDTVTVRGTLDDDTIQLTSIELMSIGLAAGEKAPAFSVRDQFGRVQTLDTLKGANGTVLLFFRSADW